MHLGIIGAMRRPLPRWQLAIVAVAIQLCLGAGYSWTVFRKPLESAYGWTYAETAQPFRYLLLAYAIGMSCGGWLQDRFGPKKIAILGGVLLSVGCILGAVCGSTPLGMSAGYAALSGLGMGFAYVPALAVLVKWFPDRRGFIVGVGVFGFGAGSMLSAPAQTWLIGSNPAYYAHSLPLTFWWMAAVFFAVVVGLSLFLVNPADSEAANQMNANQDMEPSKVVRTWQLYALWFIMLSSMFMGLSILSEAAPYLKRLTHGEVGFAVGLMGLANGLGRLVTGAASDKIGRKRALVVVFALYGISCGAFLAHPSSFAQGLAGMVLAAFAFGAGIACMPSSCADYFGAKYLGSNYGLIFTGFAISGFFGPTTVSTIVQNDPANGYRTVFLAFVVVSVAGAVVSAFLRKPNHLQN